MYVILSSSAAHFVLKFSHKEYLYAKVLLSMLDLEPNFTWQQYEHFHAHWETLIRHLPYLQKEPANSNYLFNRLVLCDGAQHTSTPWTILDLYHTPKPPQILHNQSSFYLSKRSANICEWPSHFPQHLPADISIPVPEGVTGKTIIPAANNPGFDVVGFENKRTDGIEGECWHYFVVCMNSLSVFFIFFYFFSSIFYFLFFIFYFLFFIFYFLFFIFCAAEPIVICTECRFSDPASTTKLSKATVHEKRDLTVAQFQPYFKKGMILSISILA
jgi:hypothetical protein